MEELFNIPEFDNYKVTKSGKIFSLKSNKFLKSFLRQGKYYTLVIIRNDGKCITKTIHRIVCSVFHKKVDDKDCVNHIDGDKQNNNESNLEWCSPKENQSHAVKMGLHAVCKGHGFILGVGSKGLNIGKGVVNVKTGMYYKSISKAAKELGIDRGHLGECLNGKKKNRTNLVLK